MKNEEKNLKAGNSSDAIPASEKKGLLSLIMVLTGYPIALSNFVIGGAIGVRMTMKDAIIALVFGNLVLILIAVFTGMLAAESGLSTALLSRKSFGKNGSKIFSGLLIVTSITWIAINGNIFATMIVSTFSWWTVSIAVTSILCIGLWLLSAVFGYKGLEKVAFLGVPAALLMSLIGAGAAVKNIGGFDQIINFNPNEIMTFSAATSSVIGGWAYGSTITPDISRYAKSKRDAAISGAIAFTIGCFGLQFAGVFLAIGTGDGDFVVAMASLGLGIVAFLTGVFALWTTQQNTIYASALAVKNVLTDTKLEKTKYTTLAVIVASVAAVVAALGIYSRILPVIKFLGILIPPVPAIITAEGFIVKRSNEEKPMNIIAIIAWLGGGIASYISLRINFFVPPIIGMVTSMILYVSLSKVTSVKESVK